ncbi:F-box protein [Capsicum annuum]|uniref:F-box protein n=1 Tax=Capsicum annuum TaxID=4072 RepID=A0A2G3AHK9_CAPAN|nr:F-box protein [Capsicum annuum]PHT93717.1 F-box protein [Capsicum annuum]
MSTINMSTLAIDKNTPRAAATPVTKEEEEEAAAKGEVNSSFASVLYLLARILPVVLCCLMESRKKIRGAVVSSSAVSIHEVNLEAHEKIIHSEGECLINRMNDDALIHILGFLPIKEMARTSVLSHRWRYLWRRSLIPPLNSMEVSINNESKHHDP